MSSPDASVIVGLGWNGCSYAHGFRWQEATGMADLGTSVPDRSTRANAVSEEGRVIVGWQDAATGFRQGARWVDGRQELFTGPHGAVGEAHGTNADGSLVVGQMCNSLDPARSERVDLDSVDRRPLPSGAQRAREPALHR